MPVYKIRASVQSTLHFCSSLGGVNSRAWKEVMLFYLAVVFVAFQAVVAEEPMDLTRVQRGALYIRLPARKLHNRTWQKSCWWTLSTYRSLIYKICYNYNVTIYLSNVAYHNLYEDKITFNIIHNMMGWRITIGKVNNEKQLPVFNFMYLFCMFQRIRRDPLVATTLKLTGTMMSEPCGRLHSQDANSAHVWTSTAFSMWSATRKWHGAINVASGTIGWFSLVFKNYIIQIT